MSFRTRFGIYKSKCSVDAETSSAWQYFLDTPSAFIGSMREEVQKLVDEIKTTWFETNDLKDKYLAWLKTRFNSEPDFPWPDTIDFEKLQELTEKKL